MTRFSCLAIVTTAVALLLSACNTKQENNDAGDNPQAEVESGAILGNLPHIMAEGYEALLELKEESRQNGKYDQATFKEFNERYDAIVRETVENAKKEAPRLQGREVPIVGEKSYEFMHITRAVIDTVTFNKKSCQANIQIRFETTDEYDPNQVSRHRFVYFIFANNENKEMIRNATMGNYPKTTLSIGINGKESPERWSQLKEIVFIDEEFAKQNF